jgi:hypothetical protein
MKVKRVTSNDVETDGDLEEDRNERGLYLARIACRRLPFEDLEQQHGARDFRHPQPQPALYHAQETIVMFWF